MVDKKQPAPKPPPAGDRFSWGPGELTIVSQPDDKKPGPTRPAPAKPKK